MLTWCGCANSGQHFPGHIVSMVTQISSTPEQSEKSLLLVLREWRLEEDRGCCQDVDTDKGKIPDEESLFSVRCYAFQRYTDTFAFKNPNKCLLQKFALIGRRERVSGHYKQEDQSPTMAKQKSFLIKTFENFFYAFPWRDLMQFFGSKYMGFTLFHNKAFKGYPAF